MSAPEYPHVGVGWGFPVRWDREGRVSLVRDEEEIRQAILIILRTTIGSRVMRPRWGADLDRYVFSPRSTQTCYQLAFDVRRALLLHEPRIIVDRVDAVPAGPAEDRIDVAVEYRIDTHRRPSSLVVPFYREPEPGP